MVPPGSSLVEIDLIEQPDGTLVRLTHSGLPNAEQCASHSEGWAHYLGRLAAVAAGRDPGPDPFHGHPPAREDISRSNRRSLAACNFAHGILARTRAGLIEDRAV